jgi:hypothetical protein
MQQESRRGHWTSLGLLTPAFRDLGLPQNALDSVVWQKCQQEQLVLITANRKDEGPGSLESTIRNFNTPDSLPVITLANPERLLSDKTYAARAADRLLQYLVDLDNYRGTGRLYIP